MKAMLPGLDVLRFLLACYLVVFHTLVTYPEARAIPLVDLFRFGGCATSIFFVLSGFILSHVSAERKTGETMTVAAPRFLINRFSNIYPIHIITLALSVALMAVNSHPFDTELSNLDSAPPIVHTMSGAEFAVNAVLQILLLQAWNPFYLSFNIPSWSLSTLFFFYLLFPSLAPRLLSMRRKWAMLAAMWGASLLPALIVVASGRYEVWPIGVLHTNPLVRLPEFLAGILAYGIFEANVDNITRTIARYRWIVFAALGAIFVGAAFLFADGLRSWEVLLHNGALLPAQMAVIFVCANALQTGSPRVTVWTRRLGNASLSIFALQYPLFIGFLKVQKLLGIRYSMLSCVHQPHLCSAAASRVQVHFSAYPLYLILVLVTSVLFQERIVVPLRTLLRRVLKSRWDAARPAPLPATSMPKTQ
ncbi:acyltransferase [Paraburkholderia sprentiae WSM5005]|uniref:Acyltransferase n=1 Tax=Paraburkholderia sprentiae WSM5005 TaxID=754502 RepID=A0A1I9YFT2_9BURK|nr:acyltransferase [Paraburkholderia sprentiae]APA85165.1 acyltransferase [Paraburkholderia sprentiae WSM5005]